MTVTSCSEGLNPNRKCSRVQITDHLLSHLKLESPTAAYICWEDLDNDNVAFCRINNDKAELEKSQSV